MPDYQRTIDQLRFQLQSDNLELSEELEQFGQEYADACRIANARLRRCSDFLRKGLRSEAIHYADANPNLLDLVGLLDFPEREQWEELVTLYQLRQPEPLRLELAEQLNEAYTAQQPIENLIDRHRLLALGRAPLPKRMAVLRKLAENDPEGSFWNDDLRMMEQARFREITSAAKAAAQDGNGNLLNTLVAEVTETPWCERPPKTLLPTIRRYADHHARTTARRTLEQLEQPLLDAFAALDIARARKLRDEWEGASRIAKLGPDTPMLDRVGPALGWVTDEDTREAAERGFHDALARLERVLEDDRTSLEELERLGHDVMKWGRNVPETTSNRYRNRLSSLQLAETRKHRLIIGGALLAICLVVGFVGLLGYRSLQAAEVERVASSIETMIENGELQQARELVNQHHNFPSIEAWLGVQGRLANAEKAENDRSAQLNVLVQSIPRESSHETALSLLEKARSLAKTPEEKLAIANLEGERQQLRQAFVAERESQVRNSIALIKEHLSKLSQILDTTDGNDSKFEELVATTSKGLAEATHLAQTVDSQSTAQIEMLASRLDGLTQARADTKEKSRLLAVLDNNSQIRPGSSDNGAQMDVFGQTLAKYAETYPDDPRSSDFAAAAKEAPIWQGVAAWQELLTSWGQFTPTDSVETAKRIQQCELYINDHKSSPVVSLASEYQTFLEGIRDREEGADGKRDSSIKQQLFNLYSSDLIANVYTLKNGTNGTTIYVPSDKEVTENNLASIQFYAGFNGELKSRTVTVTELTSRTPSVAPQAKIAKILRTELPKVSPSEWTTFFEKFSDRILNEPELDEFLRYFLLVRTLEYAGKGDVGLRRELEPYLQRLRDDRIDLAARWMIPNEPEADKSRQYAQEAFARLGDLSPVWNAAREITSSMEHRLTQAPRAIGYLLSQGQSHWSCRTEWTTNQPCSLAVIVPGTEGNPSKFHVIGQADHGKLQLQSWIAPLYAREGRLIFAIEQPINPENTSTAGVHFEGIRDGI